MTALDPAEIERFREQLAAAYDAQDALMERARDGEISMDALVLLSRRIVWPRWSRHTLGPCLPGCKENHGENDAHEDTVYHRATIAEVPTTQAGRLASVDIQSIDDLVAGTRGPAEVAVIGADDGLTPDQARQLAAQIMRAATRAEQWNFLLAQQGGTR